VNASAKTKVPEAGSSELSFEDYDKTSQKVRDLLSHSESLFCPEGHVPGTRTSVRIITNSKTVPTQAVAYLDRAPRLEPPESLPITAYVFEGREEKFSGYAVEEVEVPVEAVDQEQLWVTGDEPEPEAVLKSVASVILVGESIDLKDLAAALELCHDALTVDALQRESKKNADAE